MLNTLIYTREQKSFGIFLGASDPPYFTALAFQSSYKMQYIL